MPLRLPKRRRLATAGLVVALATAGGIALLAEFPEPPEVDYENQTYDGSFIFPRLRFRPTVWFPTGDFYWNLDLKWNHDYPWAEQNFGRILEEVTTLYANRKGSAIFRMDDPELFRHPWAYVCEVGFWNPTDKEAESLRQYLLKGGFLIVDDFIDVRGHAQWRNFVSQMRRVLPEGELVRLDLTNPVFHSFFQIEDLDFNDPRLVYLEGAVYGIFEDNDPQKRLMVIANYNMDIGDFWEWSDVESFYPINLTQKGFRLGVNYVIYGMTH